MPTQLSAITAWFDAAIAGSPVWAGIGLAATLGAGVISLWFILKLFVGAIRHGLALLASRKRRSTQGFGIAVTPVFGAGGDRQTKAILAALEQHLSLFTFGSPFEVVKAPRLRAKGASGLRAAATQYLEKSATDLVIWGNRKRGKQQPTLIDILSCGGSLAPAEANHLEGYFPLITAQNQTSASQIVAYLVARALQPGLSDGSAFKAEKLAPVADILVTCLDEIDALPDRTRLTLETDYASMALHLGGETHLTRVVELRRKRLSRDDSYPPSFEIQARIDLGRALLGLANIKFDPVRVREAMDHLKIAVDMLKTDPVLQMAQATNQAVQQGQSMLANRKRFSVTSGSTI